MSDSTCRAVGDELGRKGRRVVVSAVNITEGGPLTVLREFVGTACARLPADWEIIVLVHDDQVLQSPRARLVAMPQWKRGWIPRLWLLWAGFKAYAQSVAPDYWISLNDVTPNLGGIPQAVYYHNAQPFCRLRLRDALLQPRLLMYRFFYGWFARINIRRNACIVVQQHWVRQLIARWYGDASRIIVAHPESLSRQAKNPNSESRNVRPVFLYPTLARSYKNIELLCRAVEWLESDRPWHGRVIVTVDGTENRYARWLKRKFGALRSLELVGRLSSSKLEHCYIDADALLFPSRIESWGLPISEAKRFGLTLFVADLPYARETVGNYPRVEFIDPDDHVRLGEKMLAFQEGRLDFVHNLAKSPEAPYAQDWGQLIDLLFLESSAALMT